MTSLTYKLLLLILVLRPAVAGDWPEWRGSGRDGAISSDMVPEAWPERLKPRWKITVGEGHSSPVLAAGRILIFTRREGTETAASIDPADGRIFWQASYPAPYKMNPAAERHGEGPKSTPVVSAGRLYTFGISGILTCWDVMTGKIRWQKDFSKQYRYTSPLYGTAMSPMVDHGLLIAHVGGHDGGALTAFDAASGDVKWQWKGDGPAYASPIVVSLGSTRQLVTESQNNLVGISVSDGRLLWEIPFTTEYVQNIPTPLLYRDLLIFSGLSKGVMAVRPVARDGKWSAETVWRNSAVSMYMSSPVIKEDMIYGFSHYKKGQFFCIDARTGATQWTSPPRQGDNAALLLAGDNLLLLKDSAELIVAQAGSKAFALIRHYTVAESPTWAHPLVLRDGVVIKDATSLAMWSAH
jgi:outer membrane protein assembly factor BamB